MINRWQFIPGSPQSQMSKFQDFNFLNAKTDVCSSHIPTSFRVFGEKQKHVSTVKIFINNREIFSKIVAGGHVNIFPQFPDMFKHKLSLRDISPELTKLIIRKKNNIKQTKYSVVKCKF